MKKIIALFAAVVLLSTVGFVNTYAKEKVTILMNWFPQGNQSGFWQAQLDNPEYDDLEITIKSGGPRIRVITQVASGQVDFGFDDADDLMTARSKGAPVVAIFVTLDHAPYTIVYHPDQSINTIQDLNGRTGATVLGMTWWEWTKHTFGLDNVKEIPLSGDLGLFARTPEMFQTGYSIFLPMRFDAKGVTTKQFKIADYGYKPYSIVLTTEKMIRENPELVQKVVDRLRAGHIKAFANPAPTRDLILGKSKMTTPAIHNNAVRLMREDFFPKDHNKIGCQDPARWVELADQMKTIDALPADFDPHQSYDLSFQRGC